MALRHTRLFVGLLAGSLVLACQGKRVDVSIEEARRGSAVVGGGVVSTVDGHPITIADVKQLVAAGLPPDQALRRLQAERLLMAQAESRGFGRRSAVAVVAEQARVQALLDKEAAAVTVSDEEVRAAYDQSTRYVKPERRASVHVLARLPKRGATPQQVAAAKAYAERKLGELALATDLNAFISQQRVQMPEFAAVGEVIRPAERDSKTLARPYVDALFSVAAPGVVAAPVRTDFGWHAIRVTEILPPETTPFEQVADQLRAELLLARRTERVQKLVEQLRRTYSIEVEPDVAQTLAKLSL